MTQSLIGVYGAGGHGRGVMEILKEEHAISPLNVNEQQTKLVFVETSPNQRTINNIEVLSEKDFFSYSIENKYFNVAIADPYARMELVDKCLDAKIRPMEIRSRLAKIFDTNEIGDGAIFSPFSAVTVNSQIGHFFHANIYSYVEHDCIIGDFVTFSPGVRCNGHVRIENNVFVGAGATIINGSNSKPLFIGEGAIIGMGAVVINDVEPFSKVVGNPARKIKF